jgi:hypothetical protein
MECKVKFGPLTSAQIRAARALVRWRAQDLARESSVGVATIRRAELTDAETSMTAANDLAVRRALEAAGVEFIDENGGGPGVRLRKSGKEKPRK